MERRRTDTAEHDRLAQGDTIDNPWRFWGPYVSARQWGTVREDYSEDGNAWDSFPFDHAHQRAYRWGEDGIAGVCDRHGYLNLGLALWNGRDDRLKERFFGLTNAEGNHGEDVKEYWWHLDATPTHTYAQLLYRYPQAAYPYERLRHEGLTRDRDADEFELSDTGILDSDRFWDVVVTHAKASPMDLVMRVEATNHGPDPAPLHLAPQLWFRNTWSWGDPGLRPSVTTAGVPDGITATATHERLGTYDVRASEGARVLLCDNDSNTVALWGTPEQSSAHPKDAIDAAIVRGDLSLLAADTGTKAAFHWSWEAVGPGETVRVDLRLTGREGTAPVDEGNDALIARRALEADEFYAAVVPDAVGDVDRLTARRAFAGLLWGRQLYRYDVRRWLAGDPGQPTPPATRLAPQPVGRNTSWRHLHLGDVISMPDEWEYPWFATWDLAFHCVALAHVDPGFAKEQLVLLLREWAMHPNGQLPAYEWNFSDVNPPVHAWAAWMVYRLDGAQDRDFLVRVLSKLLLNFGWWVNRKDSDDSNLFEGGFLGMDNIGPFDRSTPLPPGQRLEQSDATSWMGFSCLSLMQIAIELGRETAAWDEAATKFMEHFLAIADAMDSFGTTETSLWDEDDGFFYDMVVNADGSYERIRVRSMVGLLPLLGVSAVPAWATTTLPDFNSAVDWLVRNRPDLTHDVIAGRTPDHPRTTLSILTPERRDAVLRWLLDEAEFLAPHGIRSLSAVYRDGTTVRLDGADLPIAYVPGESASNLFGGNSNWRGPVWFPVNVLLTQSLRTHAVLTGDADVEFPTGSGTRMPLSAVADALDDRLVGLFRPGADGRRPSDPRDVPTGPLWGHPTFSEYFHGDTGAGLGASHQTGWTALVAHLICSGQGSSAT